MHIAPEGYIDYGVPIRGISPLGQQQGYSQGGFAQQSDYIDEPEGAMYPPQYSRNIYPNQDQGFLKWLFDFRKESIVPLRNIWRGREYDFNEQVWRPSKSKLKIMNEDGITWSISLIESYMNPCFIVTDLDERTYNFSLREVSRNIWNSLCLRYKEFEMKKSDIPRVAEEIESKIRAVLRGALDNGYRDFFSTQNQNIETKNLSPQQLIPKQSLWSKAASIFKHTNSGLGY